jgi:Tol biopolymer transport system component/DNA-binding winged helix-turn-helix (wHTH) protein
MTGNSEQFYEFEEFHLNAANPSLWRMGKLVAISPKSLEVLILLVEKKGEIVSRDDLMETVWKDTFVEEANINYTISQLRKTLGSKNFIQTVARRGYRFDAPVRVVSEADVEAAKRRSGEAAKSIADGRAAMLGGDEASGGAGQQINDGTPKRKSPLFRFSSSPLLYLVGTILLAGFGLGFAGFRLWSGQTPKKNGAPLENVNFQKMTFTGDLLFPVLAPDGKSFAFVRGNNLFVQNVETGEEMRLHVAGEKIFGILQFAPDGESLYFRNRVSFDVAASVFRISRFGGSPKLIAENVWSGFSFSPDGRQMVFVRLNPSEAVSRLIIKNLETGAERELTALDQPGVFLDNGYPAWSPDGRKIAVVVFKKQRPLVNSELLVIDAESGAAEEIKTPQLNQFEQIAWLPGSEDLIISARENNKFFQLWRLSCATGELQKITNDLNIYRGVSLSKDGKKLLARQFMIYSHLWTGEKNDLENLRQKTFGNLNRDGVTGLEWMPSGDVLYVTRIVGDRDLWLYRAADDSRRQLTKNVADLNENPVAASDGKFIFFNSNRSGTIHVWRMDASGANPTQITFGDKQTEIYPQISPDGAWLYYIQKSASASVVRRKSLTDERDEALTDADDLAPNGFLSLSPDGKFLAFHNLIEKVNEESGKQIYQIAVIPTDKSSAPKFLSIAASRLIVRWTSDGPALDYIENDSEGAKIWRQTLDGNKPPTLVLGLPQAFLHNFAWSADGEKLVLSRGRQLNDAILLTNFQP